MNILPSSTFNSDNNAIREHSTCCVICTASLVGELYNVYNTTIITYELH